MSDDKELPPSEKKLHKALEKNQDQQSQEMTSLVSGLAMAVVFYAAVPRLAGVVTPLLRMEPLAIDQVGTLRDRISVVLGELVGVAETGAAVLFAAALLGGLLANIANRRRPPGFKMPQIKYNPMQSAKQMFQPSQVLATARLWLICVIVIAAVAYLGWRNLPGAVMGAFTSPAVDVEIALWLPCTIVPLVLSLLVVSAVVDVFQKHMQFIKNNRMDHEEVKKENKEDNGDPLIKSKRLELAREE